MSFALATWGFALLIRPSVAQDNLLIVDLEDGASLEEAAGALGLPGLRWVDPRTADEGLAVVELAGPAEVAAEARRLQGAPLVEVAERVEVFGLIDVGAEAVTAAAQGGVGAPDRVPGFGAPNDPRWLDQWHMRRAGAPASWRAGAGAGVRVAVLDTGVSRVPDLARTSLEAGGSFVPGVDSVDDGNGHGTHVAGTIAQSTHNGVGVAGMAPAVTVLAFKVLADGGFGQSPWIAAAIDEAADQGAQVINLSLGGPPSAVVELAVRKAVDRGVVGGAAAGNTGGPGVGSPASVPGVVAVAALGPGGQRAPYSTTGPEVRIAAPGGDKRITGGGVLQDTILDGGGLAELQGTSMATPHVSGAIAALIGFGIPGADAVTLLEGTARPVHGASTDQVGAGELDLGAALWAAATRVHLPRALLAALLAGALLPVGAPSRQRIVPALLAAFGAGGASLLVALPLPYGVGALGPSVPPLLWGPLLVSNDWQAIFAPIWVSAALPAGAVFVLGTHRKVGPMVGALALGWGLHAVHAAAALRAPLGVLGDGAVGALWLGLNGALALVAGLATFGVARLRARSEG
ncbi:MAG: S8 family serine peptidase [Deltaproteobacteria bacterium]|nr:S8 family serine peptidase [Deltaproteobacteria bacterium]